MMKSNVHAIINMKQELVDCLELQEVQKGRTNISSITRMNWRYFANIICHPKRTR